MCATFKNREKPKNLQDNVALCPIRKKTAGETGRFVALWRRRTRVCGMKGPDCVAETDSKSAQEKGPINGSYAVSFFTVRRVRNDVTREDRRYLVPKTRCGIICTTLVKRTFCEGTKLMGLSLRYSVPVSLKTLNCPVFSFRRVNTDKNL